MQTIAQAQAAYDSAKANNDQQQQADRDAYSAWQAAHVFSQVTAPAQAQALIQNANSADLNAEANLKSQTLAAEAAKAALSQASLDLIAAVQADQQTNAQEVIPPNQQGANTLTGLQATVTSGFITVTPRV